MRRESYCVCPGEKYRCVYTFVVDVRTWKKTRETDSVINAVNAVCTTILDARFSYIRSCSFRVKKKKNHEFSKKKQQ